MLGHDVILSTELLKGVTFHGNFQAPLVFRCKVPNRTGQELGVSLSSPSTLTPPATSFWGFYSLRVLRAA